MSAADRAGKFAPRNLVTRAGEIFKADGEVVGRGGVRPGLRPYLLTSEATSPAGASSLRFPMSYPAQQVGAIILKS